jgi:hypothetical protein
MQWWSNALSEDKDTYNLQDAKEKLPDSTPILLPNAMTGEGTEVYQGIQFTFQRTLRRKRDSDKNTNKVLTLIPGGSGDTSALYVPTETEEAPLRTTRPRKRSQPSSTVLVAVRDAAQREALMQVATRRGHTSATDEGSCFVDSTQHYLLRIPYSLRKWALAGNWQRRSAYVRKESKGTKLAVLAGGEVVKDLFACLK